MADRLTPDDLFVTTRKKPDPDEEAEARALAARFTMPYADRAGRSIAHHARETARPTALVVKREALIIVQGTRRLGFHPNLSARRVGDAARTDHYLASAGIAPGDHVLDCTCGMGADAIVAAHAVGPTGRVVALEADPILALIVARGLAHYDAAPALIPAMRRIEHLTAHADTFLTAQPDKSFDVVALDPMFAWPQEGAHGLDLIRLFASDWSPSPDTIAEATRVARRAVVMADGIPGPRLSALGIPIVSRDRRRWWGRIDCTS
ncbi:MAG: class I SAM-dependent methyltransferase [Pseudomonadota bacterium]|nr:class I SAM-dependent methyltransferase [Pseudomonadota bacterium]